MRRRWLIIVGIALASAVALAASGELLARALVPVPTQEWLEDVSFSRIRVRDASFERWTLDLPPRSFQLKTNCMGYRGSSIKSLKKPDGVKRIFFLGASSTDLPYLPEEDTFAGRVEALLREKGVACEVANAGVPGRTSSFSYHTLEHRVSQLEPDLVVVLDGFNDLGQSLGEDWDSLGLFHVQRDSVTFGGWLVHASRLARWIHGRASGEDGAFTPDWRRPQNQRRFHPRSSVAVDLGRGIPRFVHYLRRDAQVCREISCPLVLMTVPTLYKNEMTPEEASRLLVLDGPLGVKAMAGYNAAIRDVARETKATLVDLDQLLPKDVEHLYDESHPTKHGCDAIARAIVAAAFRDGKLVSGP